VFAYKFSSHSVTATTTVYDIIVLYYCIRFANTTVGRTCIIIRYDICIRLYILLCARLKQRPQCDTSAGEVGRHEYDETRVSRYKSFDVIHPIGRIPTYSYLPRFECYAYIRVYIPYSVTILQKHGKYTPRRCISLRVRHTRG